MSAKGVAIWDMSTNKWGQVFDAVCIKLFLVLPSTHSKARICYGELGHPKESVDNAAECCAICSARAVSAS